MRYGTNSQQLNRDEIRNFFREESLVNFDEKINKDFNLLKDFDENKFKYFLKIAGISDVIKKEKVLENLGLLKDGYIRNAGVLLFCSKVTRFFLNATIGCFLYMGYDKYKILDKKEFDEDILTNYHNGIRYLKLHLNTEFIIKGGPREEKLELPEDALREAVLNAIAHRDYFSTANIHINIFKDRVEIINPGGLIGNLTIKDIYERSIPRNPLLFTLMERMELVEKAGSGLVRIEKAMRDYVLERPVIQADKNWFQITFKRPDLQESTFEDRISHKIKKKSPRKRDSIAPENAPVNAPVKLTGLQERILKAIQQETNVTYDRLAKTLKKDRSTIRRNIQKLKQLDIIKRIGPDKSGHWQIFS
jgi:ATP-dependent DNA helicase RecG